MKPFTLPDTDRCTIYRPDGMVYHANEASGTILTKDDKCASIEDSTHDPEQEIHLRRPDEGSLS